LHNYKSALVTLVAMASLIVCLGFTVARLFETERELRNDGTYTDVWFVTQAQFEAAILAESLARAAANESLATPEQAPSFRTSILISRLAVLIEGPQERLMESLGLSGDLKHAYLQLTIAEPILQSGIDRQGTMLLREQMKELSYKLRDAANRIIWLSRDQAVAKREDYLRVVLEGFAFLTGIVLSAAFLLVRLFKGVQEASQAKQLLKQEQELSDLVIRNISNQGIVMFDSQLRCLLWNPGMEDLLNIKPEQAVGQRMEDLDRLFTREPIARAAGSGRRRCEFDPGGGGFVGRGARALSGGQLLARLHGRAEARHRLRSCRDGAMAGAQAGGAAELRSGDQGSSEDCGPASGRTASDRRHQFRLGRLCGF
jgi:PAS domain-containing protein